MLKGLAKLVTNEEVLERRASLNVTAYVSHYDQSNDQSFAEVYDQWEKGADQLRQSMSQILNPTGIMNLNVDKSRWTKVRLGGMWRLEYSSRINDPSSGDRDRFVGSRRRYRSMGFSSSGMGVHCVGDFCDEAVRRG